MEHRNFKDFETSVKWAKEIIFNNPHKYLILDTETTGLDKNSVVIQIGICNMDGVVLFNTLIKPAGLKSIPKEATNVHGIAFDDLKNAPRFIHVFDEFKRVISGRTVIIYNAAYDIKLLSQTMANDGFLKEFTFKSECAMLAYSQFVGEWNNERNSYKWQKLTGGNHSAIGDCFATLSIIKSMASVELAKPKNPLLFWK